MTTPSPSKARSWAAALTLFGALTLGAHAVVVLTFDDSSGSVVATWSGTLDLSGAPLHVNDFNQAADSLVANNSEIYVRILGTPSFDQYFGGSHINMGFLSAPTSHTMLETFGYSSKFVMLDHNTPINGMVSPTGTMTWAGQSLADIGLSWLTTTPTTVYNTAGAGDSIQLAAAPIPEPSLTLLLGIGGLTLSLRRSRRGLAGTR